MTSHRERAAHHFVEMPSAVRGQGVELVEERLLGLQFLAERKARVAVHDRPQTARARRDATQRAIVRRGSSPDAGNSK